SDKQKASQPGIDPTLRTITVAQSVTDTGTPPTPGPQPKDSRRSRRSSPLGLGLGGLGLAVMLLWGLVWSLGRPDPRNNPQTLLAISNGHVSTKLPGLPEPKTNLTAEDIAFGELQTERMVKDRPEMARYVTQTDQVWIFCARAFAGE